jgi:hypothetical protein
MSYLSGYCENLKTKILFVIGATFLLIGTIGISCASGYNPTSIPISQKPIIQLKQNQKTKVLVFGNCYGISVNGDIKQGEGRNNHILGRITANLSIRNERPLPPGLLGDLLPYTLMIIDFEVGVIRTKALLPTYIYLSNFTGFGFIADYHKSWGPTRAIFFLRGSIDGIIL